MPSSNRKKEDQDPDVVIGGPIPEPRKFYNIALLYLRGEEGPKNREELDKIVKESGGSKKQNVMLHFLSGGTYKNIYPDEAIRKNCLHVTKETVTKEYFPRSWEVYMPSDDNERHRRRKGRSTTENSSQGTSAKTWEEQEKETLKRMKDILLGTNGNVVFTPWCSPARRMQNLRR